jgi:triosephosphate isomerase
MDSCAQKWVIGNWKMFKNISTARQDFLEIQERVERNQFPSVSVSLAVPSLFLNELSLYNKEVIGLFAQNIHWQPEGPFTGEISLPMIMDLKVNGSLVGHSERRQYFAETDISVGKKVGTLLKAGRQAILCVGETLSERESGNWKSILQNSIYTSLDAAKLQNDGERFGSDAEHSPLLFIAYEPVWAIGTGKSASITDIEEAHRLIRESVESFLGTHHKVSILYGGSVNAENISSFCSSSVVDGVLVGGASLQPDSFLKIVAAMSSSQTTK